LQRSPFINNSTPIGKHLTFIAFILAFVVIQLGAYTRLTNAGLSCPDWPHCFGYLTAPHTTAQLMQATQQFPGTTIEVKKAWTEMVHRYFAGAEGLLILWLAIRLRFGAKNKHRSGTQWVPITLSLLLLTQVMLGMLTVTAKLKPIIVLSHLLVGISLLSCLWWTYLSLKPIRSTHFKKNISYLQKLSLLGMVLMVLQISLGGWVSTHYAGLACVDFPYCQGKLLPPIQWQHLSTDLISIHMLHRLGAIVTALYLFIFMHILFKETALKGIARLLLALLCLQFILGIFNILWLRPIWLAMSHQAVAILLLLGLITILAKLNFSRDPHYVYPMS
jgi:heme a synthase